MSTTPTLNNVPLSPTAVRVLAIAMQAVGQSLDDPRINLTELEKGELRAGIVEIQTLLNSNQPISRKPRLTN
jgi:hypothetical protein